MLLALVEVAGIWGQSARDTDCDASAMGDVNSAITAIATAMTRVRFILCPRYSPFVSLALRSIGARRCADGV